MHIENDLKLDFKDVLIRPKRSTLTSPPKSTSIARVPVRPPARLPGFPLIAANMDTIGTFEMARALARSGRGALHKHYPADALVEFFAAIERKRRLLLHRHHRPTRTSSPT